MGPRRPSWHRRRSSTPRASDAAADGPRGGVAFAEILAAPERDIGAGIRPFSACDRAPITGGHESFALQEKATGSVPNAIQLRRKPFRVKHLCRITCGVLHKKDVYLI